jgi:hypothetical protein
MLQIVLQAPTRYPGVGKLYRASLWHFIECARECLVIKEGHNPRTALAKLQFACLKDPKTPTQSTRVANAHAIWARVHLYDAIPLAPAERRPPNVMKGVNSEVQIEIVGAKHVASCCTVDFVRAAEEDVLIVPRFDTGVSLDVRQRIVL